MLKINKYLLITIVGLLVLILVAFIMYILLHSHPKQEVQPTNAYLIEYAKDYESKIRNKYNDSIKTYADSITYFKNKKNENIIILRNPLRVSNDSITRYITEHISY